MAASHLETSTFPSCEKSKAGTIARNATSKKKRFISKRFLLFQMLKKKRHIQGLSPFSTQIMADIIFFCRFAVCKYIRHDRS
jgi:hypothetical protein